jgi:hypothetical protein
MTMGYKRGQCWSICSVAALANSLCHLSLAKNEGGLAGIVGTQGCPSPPLHPRQSAVQF